MKANTHVVRKEQISCVVVQMTLKTTGSPGSWDQALNRVLLRKLIVLYISIKYFFSNFSLCRGVRVSEISMDDV